MKKNLYIILAILLSVTFVLSGCSGKTGKKSDSDACVYYIVENGTNLEEVEVSLPDGTEEEKAAHLVKMLTNPPEGKISPLCAGTKLISLTIEDEIAIVDFTKEFSTYSDPKYTLSTAALAKSLCSLDYISGVRILVEGSDAVSVDGTPIGVIMKADITDNIAPTDITKTDVTLYFANGMGEGLSAERRTVEFPASSTAAKAIVEELIKGPENDGNISIIPADTKVLSVETKNGVCFVNLSKEFIDKYQGGTAGEMLTIYSIVNTLTELDTVSSVQILIEGEKRDVFVHLAINEPLMRNKSMIIE